jgi:hypothetical protein
MTLMMMIILNKSLLGHDKPPPAVEESRPEFFKIVFIHLESKIKGK